MSELKRKASALQSDIDLLKRNLQSKEEQLQQVYRSCNHNWKVEYKPIHHEGYLDPGDPPGTMGVDWRGPVSVPPRSEERWVRECQVCGKQEETKQSRSVPQPSRHEPIWR